MPSADLRLGMQARDRGWALRDQRKPQERVGFTRRVHLRLCDCWDPCLAVVWWALSLALACVCQDSIW